MAEILEDFGDLVNDYWIVDGRRHLLWLFVGDFLDGPAEDLT